MGRGPLPGRPAGARAGRAGRVLQHRRRPRAVQRRPDPAAARGHRPRLELRREHRRPPRWRTRPALLRRLLQDRRARATRRGCPSRRVSRAPCSGTGTTATGGSRSRRSAREHLLAGHGGARPGGLGPAAGAVRPSGRRRHRLGARRARPDRRAARARGRARLAGRRRCPGGRRGGGERRRLHRRRRRRVRRGDRGAGQRCRARLAGRGAGRRRAARAPVHGLRLRRSRHRALRRRRGTSAPLGLRPDQGGGGAGRRRGRRGRDDACAPPGCTAAPAATS